MSDPASLRYAKTHEWVVLDGEEATIGITDFAVKQLTDLVYIDLPAVGSQLTQGDTFGEVESVKAVSDLYAPVSGEVIAANDSLADNLGVLSEDAFGAGWLVKVRCSDSNLSHLMDADAYHQHCRSEQDH